MRGVNGERHLLETAECGADSQNSRDNQEEMTKPGRTVHMPAAAASSNENWLEFTKSCANAIELFSNVGGGGFYISHISHG